MPDNTAETPDASEHDHAAPVEPSAEDLKAANIEELRRAVGHLSTRNAARETLLIEIERTRPDPVEVQAARLEHVVAALIPDELQRLWLEYTWQQTYAAILSKIEEDVRKPPVFLRPHASRNGTTPQPGTGD